jgi:dTDP-4-dehydrorhamnose reductase
MKWGVMTRVLVVGGSGLLGRALLNRLGPNAAGTAMSRHEAGLIPLDARNSDAVLDVARRVSPAVIMNLVAERRPAHWDDANALHASNVTSAMNAARAARSIDVALVHISTDYVFPSGGPFEPDAPHAPTNLYARTKSAAEDVVRQECPDAIIMRMPVLYGPVRHASECNLSELVQRVATATEPLTLDTWAHRRPTHVDDVAQTLSLMATSIESWLGQSAHVSAKDWYSQYDMGSLITELLPAAPVRLVATENLAPDRPQRVELLLDERTPHIADYRSLADALPTLMENYLAFH